MSEDRILESIGKLSGLVEASREDIKTLVNKQDEQTKNIQALATTIQVVKTENDARDKRYTETFTDVHEKLGRDYATINELKKKSIVDSGVEEYKNKKRAWWQYTLGIIGALLGILIGLNQLGGIIEKIRTAKINGTPSAYSAPLTPAKSDTTRGH